MRKTMLLSLPLIVLPQVAVAQDHDHSSPNPAEVTAPVEEERADDPHAGHQAMDHSGHQGMSPDANAESSSGQTMDHAAMGHGSMDHGAAGGSADIPQGPPPPEAFSGPLYAADAFVGEEEMAASRAAVAREVSGLPVYWFQADRVEYRARGGQDGYLWDVQGYYGGDLDKFWFKSEGEGNFGGELESAELQGLWSHAIGPWWDLQAGVRQDLTGPERTHAVIGIQGLAPYLFEVDAAAFLSTSGDVTARIEAELDQRITQRLILQPRAELNLAAQDIPELGVGAGLDSAELGLRLRYEFTRQFAPYVGIEQEWKVGGSADYARAAGEDPSVTNYVVGLRFWF